MQPQTLIRQFETIGARLKIDLPRPPQPKPVRSPLSRTNLDFTLDVVSDRKGELFSLVVMPHTLDTLDLTAVDVNPKLRHLLLLARNEEGITEKRKVLCGHDERHWFTAAIPDAQSVATVQGAMEALKPPAVRLAQQRAGVRPKEWNRRRNAGFVRQGEWFFLPRPNFQVPNETMILNDEPIQRPRSKPHIVQYLYRDGGLPVHVSYEYPRGLTEREYVNLITHRPEARSWSWRTMVRNPVVYAKGKICHPDHATLTLPFWHLVVMSQEQGGNNVIFLD